MRGCLAWHKTKAFDRDDMKKDRPDADVRQFATAY